MRIEKSRAEKQKILDMFEESPVVAAVKDDTGLSHALKTDCSVVFVLYGTILTIREIVEQIKAKGKLAIVHVDLIQGLGSKEVVVDFIRQNTKADGIISTKSLLVRRSQELGMIGGLRVFMIDSLALANVKKQLESFTPDFMEIMPGVIPKILKRVRKETSIPLVAGGLLSDKKDIMTAFEAGADAVSTTTEELWYV